MTARPSFFWLSLGALLAVAARGGWCAADGKPDAASAGEPPLPYVRLLVPVNQARLEDVRNQNIRYLPVDPNEFERLLATVQATRPANGATSRAFIVSAVYTARLEGDTLVDGDARLDVVHSAEGRVTMPLDPCGLAIDRPSWAGDRERPALVGWGVDKRVEVLVERAGSLGFRWSLRGRRGPTGAVAFPWEAPASPANRLVLELPEGVTPLPEHGIVVDQGPAGENTRRWQLELGTHHRAEIRCVPPTRPGKSLPSNRVRQSTEYNFSLHGVDVRTRLEFDVYGEPVRQLAVVLDPGLQMANASYVKAREGDTRLEWTASSDPAVADRTRIVLEFPEPLDGVGRVVELRARAPLETDRRWRLPAVRPQDVFWEEGEAALSVPIPLQLEELRPQDGRQSSKVAPLAAPRSGERYEVRYFSPDASTEIVLTRPEPPLELDSASVIDLGGGEAIGRIEADVRVDRGERFQLEADVQRRWTIDSVETVPPEALANWDLEENQGAGARLTIALAGSLPERQSGTPPVRVQIAARRPQAPMVRGLGMDDLTPLRFSDALPGRRLVWLRAPGPYDLELTGADTLARVDPQSLDAGTRALFRESPGEPLFENDAGAADLRVSRTTRKPGYTATIEVEAAVTGQSLVESYRFRCAADAARMDRVIVRFSRPSAARTNWTVGTEAEGNWTARRLTPAGEAASPPGPEPDVPNPESEVAGMEPERGGETWEIKLHRPRSEPFEIRASRTTELPARETICLASLPEADVEQGTVVVRSMPGSAPVWIDNERLDAIPFAAAPPGRQDTLRAAFRFDPRRDVDAPGGSGLDIVRLDAEDAVPSAWAWSCRLQSRFEGTGVGQHLAAYRLENTGMARLRIALPPAAAGEDLRGVWVGGRPVTCRHSESGAGRELAVDLPPGDRFPLVSISFTTDRRPLGIVDTVTPPWPSIDVPVLGRRWTVWLPPPYQAHRPDLRWQEPWPPAPGWAQRLFGPLGRPPDTGPFDPLAVGDWPDAFRLAPTGPSAVDEAGGAVRTWGEPAVQAQGDVETADLTEDTSLAGAPGWTVYRFEASERTPVRLELVHRDTMQACGWAAFLAVIGIGWWKALRRPAVLIAAFGLFGISAFLLPDVYATVATGAVLGTAFVLMLRLVSPTRPGTAASLPFFGASPPHARAGAAVRFGIILFALIAVLVFCAGATGGEAGRTSAPAWAPAYGVLIPTDEDGRPTGDKYQVPEEFYKALERLATAAAEPSRGFLVGTAAYRGELTREQGSQRLALGQLTAVFEIEVLSPSTRVLIPFGEEGPSVSAERALLDDRSIQPEMEEGSLAFTVSEPGSHKLTLELEPTMRPTAASNGPFSGFDLAIPRLPASKLELTVPGDAPTIEVLSAAGLVRQDPKASPPRVYADLGPVDRLSVRWPDRAGRNGSGRSLGVEELLWLKVQPGSVVLECRFRVTGGENRLSELHLAADPRLHLQPVEGAQIHATPGLPLETIRLEFSQPLSDQKPVEATFLLRDASGIGSLGLPHLELLDCRSTRRWMAVSVDPSLEAEEEAAGQLPRASSADFLTAWGKTAVQPDYVCSLAGSPTAPWRIATRPVAPKTAVDQTVAWRFARGRAGVQLDARLDTTAGYHFQYRLSGPPALEVESVSLLEGTAERVDRWRKAPDGTISVFLKRAVAGRQVLSLQGRLPTRARGDLALPLLRIEGAEVRSSVIQIFRTPDVQVAIGKSTGLVETEAPVEDESRDRPGRLLRCFRCDLAQPVEAVLKLSPNRPVVRARQITSLHSEEEAWKAKAEFHLQVTGGVLDEFRLRLPPQCRAPYEIDPPATWHELEDDSDGARRLVARPGEAVTGKHRFSIACALTPPSGDRLRVPEIVLQGADLTEHVLVVPTSSGSRPIAWETALAQVPLPDDLAPPAPATEAAPLIAYRVDQGPLEAFLRPPVEAPEVRLLDVRLAWQAGGECFHVATFDLEPAGMRECTLHLPVGCDLLHVAVADVPAAPVRLARDRWRIRIGSRELPQPVHVVVRGRLSGPDSTGSLVLDAPALHKVNGDALPVRRTLWTVSSPAFYRPETSESREGFRQCSRLDLALARAENLAALLDRATRVTVEEPGETTHWHQNWLRRYVALRNETDRQIAVVEPKEPTRAVRARLQSLAEDAARVADRVGSPELLAAPVADSSAADLPDTIRRDALERSPADVCGFLMEGVGPITLGYRRAGGDSLAWRLRAAAGLAAAVLLTLLGLRWRVFTVLWRRWPCMMGVAAGLAWWLWLWPSVLGWGIGLLSLAASFRWGWRRSRRSGSAVVPLSVVRG